MERRASGETLSGGILAGLQVQHPQIRTRDWKKAAKQGLMMAARHGGSPRAFCAAVNALNFIPDGYIVDARERSLHFFEIEIYNPMERAKLQAYAAFVTDMHWYDIEFGVYACNKHGHINRVDLLPHYIEWVESLGRE